MSMPPIIDPKYLSAPADVEIAIQALRRPREGRKFLTDAGLTFGDKTLPCPNFTSDAEMLIFIASSLIEIYHAATTCQMGRKNHYMAVVDSAGWVFVTQRLRFVDASLFQFLPPGLPQATVYMLAEKIADQILRDL